MARPLCQGDRVYLRPVERADAPRLTDWKNDPLIRRMALDFDLHVSVESQLEDIEAAVDSPSQLYLMVVLKETGRPIGYVRVHWLDEQGRFAWLRFALGEERGKGLGTDAVGCLLDHLFQLGMHRADAEVYWFNQASIALLKGLGFKQEGIKREAHWDGKTYWDVLVFGLLRADFRSRRLV